MRQLEELAANAWPGLRCALVDGWIARFANAYTRRANSVLPLAAGNCNLADRITRCEELYQMEGQDPIFKIYPEAQPEDLDAELARRGYARQASSKMMALDALDLGRPAATKGWKVCISPSLTSGWSHFHAVSSGLDPRKAAAAKGILEAIVPERRFLMIEGSDAPAACALIVLENGWAGIFDVMVRKEWRGHGLGRAIMRAALAEAASTGARHSYLQVLDDNPVAVNLYRNIGYRSLYPYWFRVPGKGHAGLNRSVQPKAE
jgi:GNAT superfamily N-acetyltransferase